MLLKGKELINQNVREKVTILQRNNSEYKETRFI